MNPTSTVYRPAAAGAYRLQARPARRAQQRRHVTPRAVLHLLVGAITLVSAQAFLKPLTRSWEGAVTVPVAYAEQRTGEPATVVAPALSSSQQPVAPRDRQQAGRPDVMSDLSSTIGRPAVVADTAWQGVVGQAVNRRAEPNRSKPPVGELTQGTPVEVVQWVAGEEVEPQNTTWAELSDGTYVFSTSLRRSGEVVPQPLPADAPTEGRWIDVNLTEQVATAYEGRTAVKSVLVSTGRPGWETPVGTFPVLRRVEKDTMDGATLVGQGPNGAGASYKVEDVRHVQYFTQDGAALHENYWRRPATFGMPGSHGCIGMAPADAAWFWEFAKLGTPLVIHE